MTHRHTQTHKDTLICSLTFIAALSPPLVKGKKASEHVDKRDKSEGSFFPHI